MKYIIILLSIFLTGFVISSYWLYKEKNYYLSTTYDPERFAEKAPIIREKLDELGDTINLDLIYISLFHNGLRWQNDEFHPPLVNEVFFWRKNTNDDAIRKEFNSRLATYQNIPLDSIPRIHETLQGKCVGIRIELPGINDGEFDVDLRCPLVNQRNEVVGYFGALTRNPTDEDISKYTNIMALYQPVFAGILFQN